MTTVKNIFTIFILSLCIIYTVQSRAYADDETKRIIGGLAVGILGKVLENATNNEEQKSSEDIQWNDGQSTAKIKKIQQGLKETGYYHGAVDGIAGSGTRQAILKWEEDFCDHGYSDSCDGVMDDIELGVLQEEVEAKRYNQRAVRQNRQKLQASSSNQDSRHQELSELYKSVATFGAAYDACKRVRNEGCLGCYGIHDSIAKNYQDFVALANKQAAQIAECKNIDDEELSKIKKTSFKTFSNSQDAKLYKLGAAAVLSGHEDMDNFVQGCNTISQSMYLLVSENESKAINMETCGFQ